MFAYLSKKIGIQTPMNMVAWNQDKGYIAVGGDGGLLKIFKLDSGKGQGGGNFSMNQALQGHSGMIQVIQWNDQYQKLTTSDEAGLIIVWMMHKQHWYEEMINNRNKSVVTDMKWTPNGEKIGIVYEDGAVIVGSVEGTRLWGKELQINLKFIEWSPDSKTILFGTPDGAVNVYDYVGNFQFSVKISCLRGIQGSEMPLAAIEWYDQNKQGFSYEDASENSSQLCIAYQCGRMQLMKDLQDSKPYLVDTGMFIKSAKWNPNGNVLAVCGSIQENGGEPKGVVQFYSSKGQHLRSLRVPGQSGMVNSIAWEGFGLRIVLAIDSNVLFANIQPEYIWSYFNNTIVFAYRKPERNDMCITFWNTKINEKCVKYMKSLLTIKAHGDYCVLVSKLTEPECQKDTWAIQLSNAIGCPVESKNIGIEPKHVAMNATHIIVASDDVVFYWQYRASHSKVVSLE
jgi:WD repeat-containing protein 35